MFLHPVSLTSSCLPPAVPIGRDAWMVRNDLDYRSLERLTEAEARLSQVASSSSRLLDEAMLDELRMMGAYEHLVERMRDRANASVRSSSVRQHSRTRSDVQGDRP